MVFALSPAALSQAYRLEFYDIVDSTNNLAAEFAKSGDSGRLWLAAAEQTSGRGRRGRAWHSPRGNLYASLLLVDDFSPDQAAQLGFVAGLAVIEALAALLPARLQKEHNICVKWPNDILVDKAKLAGILPEFIALQPAAGGGAVKNAAIIGIGVNVAAMPAGAAASGGGDKTAIAATAAAGPAGKDSGLLYPAVSLRALGAACSPAALFQALSHFWVENYALWDKGQGMAALRDKWLRHAAFRGEVLHLQRHGRAVSGVFTGIDAKGHLVLQQENGDNLLVSAGDVYFGAVASGASGSR